MLTFFDILGTASKINKLKFTFNIIKIGCPHTNVIWLEIIMNKSYWMKLFYQSDKLYPNLHWCFERKFPQLSSLKVIQLILICMKWLPQFFNYKHIFSSIFSIINEFWEIFIFFWIQKFHYLSFISMCF